MRGGAAGLGGEVVGGPARRLYAAAMEHQAQLVPIDTLKPYKGNPRTHNLDAIRESLRVNGQYRPVVVSSKTREVLAGNGTMEALQAEEVSEIWATFVDCDAKTAKRIVIVDNRTNDLAGYDEELLAGMLGNLPSLEGTGWDEKQMVSFLAGVNGAGEGDGDTEPGPLPDEPRTKAGDLWVLGEHRLLCGDATVRADVARLMTGAKAQMAFTDPPYGVGYEGGRNPKSNVPRKRIADDQDGTNIYAESLPALAAALDERAALYIWFAGTRGGRCI